MPHSGGIINNNPHGSASRFVFTPLASTSASSSDAEAMSILNDVFSMDAQNINNRNLLQNEWLNEVMQYNSAEAQKNRDFQAEENRIARLQSTELANSAYSRAIADLRNNGINPYFAITKGLSASSPTFSGSSGSASSVSAPSASAQSDIISGFTSVFNNLVNNAFANKKLTVDGALKLTDSFLSVLK